MADDGLKSSSQETPEQTACYANPEPPPEIQQIQQDDLVGNTMFSKHWLFGVLLKLIEKVDHDEPNSNKDDNDDNKENGSPAAEPVAKELDAGFEKDLCDLWDMTVEKDVCNLLDEFNSLKIFEGYMVKYDLVYPRATEILIGILVNMVSLSSAIANKLVNNTELMSYLVNTKLNQMNDVPVFIQVIRLLTTILTTSYSLDVDGQTSLAKHFIETYFKTNSEEANARENQVINENFSLVVENFNFIFNSSLNAELLDCTCLFITNLMDTDEQMLDAFSANAKFLESICNAAHTRLRLDRSDKSFTGAQFTSESNKRPESEHAATSARNYQTQPRTPFQAQNYVSQVSEDDISSLDHLFNKFFTCLQSISTCELGVIALSEKSGPVIDLLNLYLERCVANFNDWEVSSSNSLKSSICSESLQNFVCLISLLNCLFSNMSQVHKSKNGPEALPESQNFDINTKYHLNFSLKLFTLCKYYINLISETEKAAERSSESEDEPPAASFFQMDNFEEMVKSNMQDFLNCFIELHGHLISETKNKSLFSLLNDCTNLLSNLS